MADTIRSLAELNAQFADNGLGAITPQDIRDLVVSQMVHGEIGSGAKANITLGVGYQPLDLTVAGVVGRGLTVDVANRWLADMPVDLKALVTCEVCFRGAAGNNYNFSVFRNPSTAPEQQGRLTRTLRVSAAGQIVTHSWSTSLQLLAGDTVQMGVQGDGLAFELLFGLLRVQRIGAE